jgi:transcriptional regulator with XRE-family HTH domain
MKETKHRTAGDFMAAFGKWVAVNPLRSLRKKKGLSQAVLGAMLGLGHHRISDFESGLAFPSQEQVTAIGKALGAKTFTDAWAVWLNAKPDFTGGMNGKGKRATQAG